MTVTDNIMLAESWGDFFKKLSRKELNVSKKQAKNVLRNPSRALVITANIATAAASRSPKKILSTSLEAMNF